MVPWIKCHDNVRRCGLWPLSPQTDGGNPWNTYGWRVRQHIADQCITVALAAVPSTVFSASVICATRTFTLTVWSALTAPLV